MRAFWLAFVAVVCLGAREPLAQRIGHTDPAKFEIVKAVHEGPGQMSYAVLLDSHSLETNLSFVSRGVLDPKNGIGHHFHNGCEEMLIILDGEAQVTVDYVYSGGHGTPVYVGAFPTQGGVQQVAAFGFVPASIPSAGSGSVTVGLRYMASGCASTDGIRVLVYDATAGATFLTGDASYSADWGTCGSSSALPTISVTVDRGCGATYDPGDPITVLVSASEAVTATLVDFENTGLQKQTDLGLVPAFGAASVNGTVSGPAGLETLVVMARTASAVWISAGCTISVGGTSPSLVSLSLDRGCGATYHYGETATAIIQSSVAGIARLYEVTRDGQVAGMTILPLTPGLTETVSAPIGSITGTGTLVLQAESTSGQTLTASCSYSVLP